MKSKMGFRLSLFFITSLFLQTVLAVPIATTRHNLSASGPGPLRASAEQNICIFCHGTHRGRPSAPLWNRNEMGGDYIPYTSSTAVALPGQPTGESLLCLSCHDGTIALGKVRNRAAPIQMRGGVTTLPSQAHDRARWPRGRSGPGYLGKDLSDDHPISFRYSSLMSNSGELVDPGSLTGPVKLDAGGELQCTTCHNAHDDTFSYFLVMSNQASALCVTCHQKNFWSQSSHNLSSSTWNRIPPDPWPVVGSKSSTVADGACENCHMPHTAGGSERLLIYNEEEDNCTACHNGNVAKDDVMADFDKLSAHSVTSTVGVHDPTESAIIQARHVECADCHEPHASSAIGTGSLPGALNNVRGVDLAGTTVKPIVYEYQLCFRCHADSTGQPASPTLRQLDQINVRLEFDTGSPSFHPVTGPGTNGNVPSLIAPLTETDTITCGDCHNSNSSSKAGALGPDGPHGSIYPSILIRQNQNQDNTPEGPSAYALCYGCHDRNSILNNDSFKQHEMHTAGIRAPCSACHDPHGISSVQGNAINNSHLINFDITIVTPNANGELRFEDRGSFAGACYLNCHGKVHNPLTYP
jgi:predicted CXXCH cytochrome family protein